MKSNNSKTILISCAVILVVACLCLGLILAGGIGVSFLWPLELFQENSTSTPQQEETLIPTETSDNGLPTQTSDNALPTQQSELPDAIAEVILQIESQVSQIRGLSASQPVDRSLITLEELEEIVVEDFFSEYTDQDARQDVLILSLLGLLPEDFDLKSFYNDLYSEQIAGFYDDETQELFVVQGMSFGGSEKLTYAHEFTHVLQDQNFGFEEGLGLDEDSCEADSERCAAVQALIEGDASLTEVLWFQSFATRDDYNDLREIFENFATPVLDEAPPYMAADLYFPYEKGLAFTQHLYDQGGFSAVDAAFENPPLSTEQILHPERYPEDSPLPVSLPDFSEAIGEGWTLFDQNVMGEWYTYLILNRAYEESYRLSENLAREAAQGWGGDAYAFYINESSQEVVFVMDVFWDTLADAGEFAEAFEQYADLRWDTAESGVLDLPTWRGSDTTTSFLLEGNRTVWVTAPAIDLIETIFSSLQ